MASPSQNTKCGVCSGSLASQAIFTAECSHSFHFGCISSITVTICPVCQTQWSHLPFNNYNNPFLNRPFQSPPYPVSPFPLPRLYTQIPQPQFPPQPALEPEPLQFSDDEPLPSTDANPISSLGLQKVSVKAVPERSALAASESVSLFTVLVGLKAPPLLADARCSQRAPIDLVTVLDVSGSMYGTKLNLLKRAVHFVIDNLGPSDRLSIVSFSSQARRMLPLLRMTERGREDAKVAVNSLLANGDTDIVQGLKKGAQVLGERHHKNPVTSIIFLSDGNDTCNSSYSFSNSRRAPEYLHLLPPAIFPGNGGSLDSGRAETIPVHSFGFGSDHDPITMHAISDASGGTFSFIESYEMVQDAFASCIGGLLSVVTQELRLTLRSASHGVEIKSIPSGRYASEITNQGSEGLVNIGDLYADEEKEFLINMSVPVFTNDEAEESERKTSLLDIMCSYKDVVSKETVQIESELVEIRRPKSVSPQDMIVNLEVDRQRNRLRAAESIAEAQKMAEMGNLTEARTLLAKRRTALLATASAQAGDGLCRYLEADMKETERRMGSVQQYQQAGRAYALSGMSSHFSQRATTKGNIFAEASPAQSFSFGGVCTPQAAPSAAAPYSTPNMNNMVFKSQQLNKKDDTTAEEK